jgi:hypothetical protein
LLLYLKLLLAKAKDPGLYLRATSTDRESVNQILFLSFLDAVVK